MFPSCGNPMSARLHRRAGTSATLLCLMTVVYAFLLPGCHAVLLTNAIQLMEYIAMLQKKDPEQYSLSWDFYTQQHQDEHQDMNPIEVAKFRRWNCISCLDSMNSANRIVSPKQNVTNSECPTSFVWNVTSTNVHHTRTVENCTKELQGTPDNLDVMVLANISNAIPMDASPEALHMIPSKKDNHTHNLSSPQPCEVLNRDGNESTTGSSNGGCSARIIVKSTKHEGPKPMHRYKCSQVHNKGPHQLAASSKKNVGSSIKKLQSPVTFVISNLKWCHTKRRNMRQLSKSIKTDRTRCSAAPADSIDVAHARTKYICQSNKSKVFVEVEKDAGNAVSTQRTEEIQSIIYIMKTCRVTLGLQMCGRPMIFAKQVQRGS